MDILTIHRQSISQYGLAVDNIKYFVINHNV